jgi:gamma-glutamyltranspeptidase
LADAKDPVEEFYNGQLAKQMVEEFKRNGKLLSTTYLMFLGGILTEEDFRSYKSILRPDDEVIYVELADGKIRGCGPPPVSFNNQFIFKDF